MKRLKDFIKESVINESNPRGDYKVIKPMKTDFLWEYYELVDMNEEDREEREMYDCYKNAKFDNFIEFAKKKKWKEENGSYIIPKGTKLYFEGPCPNASWIGLFRINNEKDVFITFTYDELQYGEYDEYLKEM